MRVRVGMASSAGRYDAQFRSELKLGFDEELFRIRSLAAGRSGVAAISDVPFGLPWVPVAGPESTNVEVGSTPAEVGSTPNTASPVSPARATTLTSIE